MPYFSSFDTCEEKSKEAVSFRVGNSKCQWFCIFQWNCWPREFAWQNRTFWRSASEGEANFWWRKEWNSLKQRLDHGTRDQPECFASPSHELYLDSSVLYVQSEQFLNCWQDTLQTLQFRGLKRPSAKQRNQHSLQFSSITTTVNK